MGWTGIQALPGYQVTLYGVQVPFYFFTFRHGTNHQPDAFVLLIIFKQREIYLGESSVLIG